ncbi:MAG: hypothetical protein ACI8X5_001476 [Planctomycetota bacterium]|jgi:hypothetical protein
MHKNQVFSPMRALNSAWLILMKAPLAMWVGGLILVVVDGFGSSGDHGTGINFRLPKDMQHMLLWILPLSILGLLILLAVLALSSWIRLGFYKGVRTVMRRGEIEFEELFRRDSRWLDVFLATLLNRFLLLLLAVPFGLCVLVSIAVGSALNVGEGPIAAMGIISSLAYAPIAVYVALGLGFMSQAVVLDECGPLESVGKSWAVACGVRFQLIGIHLALFGLAISGVLACCLGVIVTATASKIGAEVLFCELYIQASREDGGEWWIDGEKAGPTGSSGGGTRENYDDESGWDATVPAAEPREVEAEVTSPVEPDPEPKAAPTDEQDLQSEPGSFDPSAWRKGSDIPPIERDE